MARAETKTWLSLDEWAHIIGINPLAFNGLSSDFFQNNVCGDIFFQYDWQHSDRTGRETIAMAIQQAEMEMSAEAGFNLMPDWTEQERLSYATPGVPGMYGMNGLNPRGMYKSVETRKGKVLYGGIRTKSAIQSGAAIVRSDTDGDGYQETCTVIVATTLTDTNEIHAYYPGQSADDAWEIRPIKVSISGGNATITFKAWQVTAANQMDRLDASPLDATLAASYETQVDVYRVYNDPSLQLQFMWENIPNCLDCGCGSSTCAACNLSTQYGCFHLRDQRLGSIVPAPGTWNASTLQFDQAEFSACRDPDQVVVWYRSGWLNNTLPRPYAEMDPYWKYAIAYFAASKFERPICGCSNVNQFIEKWRRDAAYDNPNEGGWKLTAEQAGNKLGTTMGAFYAYRAIHHNGIRVIK